MHCPECGIKLLSFAKYIIHIKYFHQRRNYFICPKHKCNRIYTRRQDLKKHFCSNHEHHKETTCLETDEITDGQNLNQNVNQTANTIQPSLSSTDEINSSSPSFSSSEIIKQNLEKLQNIVIESVHLLISKLYDNLTLNRTAIQSVLDLITTFFNSGLISIVQDSFKICGFGLLDSTIFDTICAMFELLKNPFLSLNTEYKRVKFFENSNKFIKPVEYKVGTTTQQIRKNNTSILNLTNRFIYYIPMNQMLTLFLELPNVYDSILTYQKMLLNNYDNGKHNILSSIVHGDVWKHKRETFKDRIVFPIILYFDDYEPGNPLGSHAGCYKIGTIYYNIATIPPVYATRLENIFLASIFYSDDRVEFGNKKVFEVIIKQLHILENEGLLINTLSGKERVFFSVAAIIGDNLGLHSIFGLFESFSATYYCRFCTCLKTSMNYQIYEDENLIRRSEDYNRHLTEKIGVKENCTWHELHNFHIYENLTCDVMHDVLEGVLRYDLALIFNSMIRKKYFTLEVLNSRIKYFTYEKFEKNIPPGITKDHLKNACIILSASEMMCLARNLRFILGDIIPEDDDTWLFYLVLLDIIDILFCPDLTTHTLQCLKSLIEEHHALYIELFKTTLKPKHHFLLHYVRIITKIGPPVLISCMRFEGKHKEFKSFAANIRSRKNLPFSLAFRAQLKSCYRLLSKRGLDDIINFDPHVLKLDRVVVDFLEKNNFQLNDYCSVGWYEQNGIKYDLNSVLLFDCWEDVPQFCEVESIFVNMANPKLVYVLLKTMLIVGYSTHYKAYKVVPGKHFNHICKIEDLYSNIPTTLRKVLSGLYISVSLY